MSAALLGVFCAAAGALFDAHTIPLPAPESRCFIGQGASAASAHLFVLHKNTLTVYRYAQADSIRVIELAAGVSAVDVADIDGDGAAEVIAIRGNDILRYPLAFFAPETESPEPDILFSLETHLAHTAGAPFPHVLVVQWGDTPVLALPREDALELRDVHGVLAASFAATGKGPQAGYSRPFNSREISPPQVGPEGALEFSISRVVVSRTELPLELLPPQGEALGRKGISPRQAQDAGTRAWEAWPWFPLRKEGAGADRVLYALSSPRHEDTLIRMQWAPSGAEGAAVRSGQGSERRYPGALLLAFGADLPDFNGDGYHDLALWKVQRPAFTASALTRALIQERWEATVTAHLFAPERGRFEPRPASRIRLDLPVSWFLGRSGAMAPMRFPMFCDFDGDGRTDFACCTGPSEVSVWRFTEDGFSQEPDFTRTFSERIKAVAFRADLDGFGRTSLGFRGDTRLFVLRADREQPLAVVKPGPPNP